MSSLMNDDERIALFLDYENLAIGARDRGGALDVGVIMDALSERGRLVIRRAYADWANPQFGRYQQDLAMNGVDLIQVVRFGTAR